MRSYFLLVSTIVLISFLFFLYHRKFKFKNKDDGFFKYSLKCIPSFTILLGSVYFSYYEAGPFIGDDPPIWHSLMVTTIMFGLVTMIVKVPYDKFLSTNTTQRTGAGWSYQNYRKTRNTTTYDVETYPRITIFKDNELVFDSSDFEVINKALGTFESIQPSFQKGYLIRVEGKEFKIEKITVDLLNVFLDYSEGHTKMYKGQPIPYNVQILLYVV